MQADLAMSAAGALGEVANLAISLPCSVRLSWVRDLADEVRQQGRVALLPQQNAIGWTSVASRATCFLIVLLNRLRQRKMNHCPNGSLVDAEPEGDRAHEHTHFVRHPAFLISPPLIALHLPVVADRRDALLLQHVDGLLHSRNGRRINDYVSLGRVF